MSEKKTFNLKVILTLFFGGILSLNVIYYNVICSSVYNDGCVVFYYNDEILKPIFIIVFFLFFTSLSTFFISDKIFKKWLKFTFFYLLSTVFLVYKAPVSAGGALGVGPDKELVSIWMGLLFVIISIIMFIWMTIKEKR